MPMSVFPFLLLALYFLEAWELALYFHRLSFFTVKSFLDINMPNSCLKKSSKRLFIFSTSRRKCYLNNPIILFFQAIVNLYMIKFVFNFSMLSQLSLLYPTACFLIQGLPSQLLTHAMKAVLISYIVFSLTTRRVYIQEIDF